MGHPPERRCDQSNMRILVIGCGYVGLPLAQTLARMGHQVHGTRRSEFSAADVTPHALDVTDRSSFDDIPETLMSFTTPHLPHAEMLRYTKLCLWMAPPIF